MSIFAICLATLSIAPAEVVLEPGQVEVVVSPAARESRLATCFAAEEMTNFLSRVLGSPVPVALRPSGTRTAIVLGTNEWSASAGIDISALPRDAVRIRTAPNRVYIAGTDEGGFDIRRGKRAYFLQHGTLNGVYAVLERFAGCRFYFPGELGEIVPRADRVVIPATDFTDRPDYTVRSSTRSLGQWPEEYPASAKTETEARFFLRLRLSTERIPCCHGQCRSGFAKRFGKTHPEYFRVKADGTRHIGDPEAQEDCDNWKNSSVCNSSAIWDEIYRDAKSYLSGEGPEVRGMCVQNGKDGFRWGSQTGGGKYYDIMPNDGMHKCFCAQCQAEYAKARDASDYADDFIWRKVAEVGSRLKADGVKGTVTMMAYHPYVGVPDVDIPENVAVMVCNNGPWLRAGTAEAALANVRAWAEKLGGKVWLWHNTGRYSTLAQNATDVPSPTPRTFGHHYQDLAPWIFGAYCSNNSQRFLYSAINYYVFYKVAWDNKADVDGMVDEYVRLMFGAAAKPMGEFFDLLERTWMEKVIANVEETPLGTMVVPPSEYAFWAKIYDLRFLGRLAALLDVAEKAVVPGSLEARRVALFRREYLEPMYPHARAYDTEGVAKEKARRAANPKPSLVQGFRGPVTIEVTGEMTNKLFHGTSFKVDLESGKTYRLSYFIRGTDIVYNHRWGCAGVTVWFNRGADRTLAILGGGLCGTFDWIHQEKVFTVPDAEGTGKFRTAVSLRVGRATGKAEFDGLVVEEVKGASPYAHCVFDRVDLAGTWEMAYSAEPCEGEDVPRFAGVRIDRAIPGNWEDVPQFAEHAQPFVPESFPMRKRVHTVLPGQIRGTFLYRRTVELDEVRGAGFAFDCVRNHLRAWVNGRYVGHHAGYSTPFELPIPDGFLRKGTNEIVLAISNEPVPGAVGGASVGTAGRAVFQWSGGTEGAAELRFAKSGLSDVYVTTAEDLRSFTVHVSGGTAFGWRVLDGERTVRSGSAAGDFSVATEGLGLWSPEHPKLYGLELKTRGGTFRTRFGIRRLVARGEKLFLNGEPIYLRGVTDHCWYAKTIHLSRDPAYYRMVAAKRKELGFNFVRLHTYVPPEEFFDAMDESGCLVHVESPNRATPEAFAEIVAFARRHPCAVIYCGGNENNFSAELEKNLERISEKVHEMSDALFSPMSALRNAEYCLDPKIDRIVDEPFPHNPDRLARLARLSDVFTSYQLGYVSYESLDGGSVELLDRMGDVYCGKPRLAHETCIDGSYVDFSLEKLYPAGSPFLKTGIFDGIRRQLVKKGLMDRADVYFRNSCEWMWRIRKHCFEKLRAADRISGFDFLGDINTHWHTCGYSVGMMDEFYRLKPGETVENVRRYNSAAVLLCDLGRDFVFRCGEEKSVGFRVSNYVGTSKGGVFRVTLETADGKAVGSSTTPVGALGNGRILDLPAFALRMPESSKPQKYMLKADLKAGNVVAANQWEMYAFPEPVRADVKEITVFSGNDKAGLLADLAAGKRVVVFGAGPFKSLPTTFRIGLAGRSAGNYATVVKDHPALGDFPHEGYCGWQFYRLFENASAIQLEGDVPFDPIVDIASSVKVVIRQALLAEYRVGKGRLLVSGFRFHDDDPAGVYLKAQLLAYAASDRFAPKASISPEQLVAVIDAPIVTGSADTNRANDTNAN